MWMCDEINVAQVKRAGRDTARPHGSLSAHIQIHKFMLHKQFECQHIILPFVFIYSSLLWNFKNICFVVFTAIALILHMKHCSKAFDTC